MGPQKRGEKVVDLAAKKTTIRDDFYKYFTPIWVQASGTLIVELHRPGFKCLISRRVTCRLTKLRIITLENNIGFKCLQKETASL